MKHWPLRSKREPTPRSLRDFWDPFESQDGQYILNCQCGDPGCARLRWGIKVRYNGDYICWRIDEPIKAMFAFRRSDYEAEVTAARRLFWALRQQYLPLIRQKGMRLCMYFLEDSPGERLRAHLEADGLGQYLEPRE